MNAPLQRRHRRPRVPRRERRPPEDPARRRKGRFLRWRRIVYAILILHYLALPFIKNGKHPAIHLDIEARRFYLAGMAFNAQDVWLVVFLLASFAFGLVFLTSWAGRVWCGWGCPQTVFLEGIFRPIERLLEGPASKRQQPRRGEVERGAGGAQGSRRMPSTSSPPCWLPTSSSATSRRSRRRSR